MKHNILSLIAIAVLAMSVSCSKENITQQEDEYQGGPFEVTITGEMGEFAPTTKSTAETCVRMKWSAGDIVYAYGSDGSSIVPLGPLTVSIDDGDYIAVMKGTLTAAPADAKNTLYLVHSPLLTAAPTLTDNALTVDMSAQDANVTPFVAYAVVKGVTPKDKYVTTGLKTKFSFATSVLKVNATGITKGATLTSASISDIETACKLTISDGAFDVAGETSGTITKALSGTASLSRASFYVSVPSFSAGAQRVLTVTAGGKGYLEHKVMQTAYAANNYVNYVYEVKTLNYIDEHSIDRGVGTYIASTGVVWAPVNCGYEPSTTSPAYSGYPYGKFYQWGRKYGQGYDGDATTTTIAEYWAGTNGNEVSNTFYKKCTSGGTYGDDWIQNGSNAYWNTGTESAPTKTNYDPCPTGWRVPTYAELNALTGNRGENHIYGGCDETQKGYWFNGSANPSKGDGLFLPAAGYRDSQDGNAYNRGVIGRYWSSSVNGNNGRYLHISLVSGYISAYMWEYGRAYGCSIRCVQE